MDSRRLFFTGLLAAGLAAGCEEPRETEPVTPSERVVVEEERAVPPVETTPPGELAENERELPPGQIEGEPGEMGEARDIAAPPEVTAKEGIGDKSGIFTVTAIGDFDEVTDRLDDAVDGMDDFKISKAVKQHEKAEEADIDLGKSVVFTIENPELTSTLMQQSPTFGLDLPHRVLVYEQGGQTHIAYYDPKEVASRHGISQSDPTIVALHGYVTTIVNRAAKPEKGSAVLGEEEIRDDIRMIGDPESEEIELEKDY